MLNVGFGLGLVDNAIQSNHPASHTIIEAHPDVLHKVHSWSSRKLRNQLSSTMLEDRTWSD